MTMITEIETYFTAGCGRCERFATPECSTQVWAAGLAKLRQLCVDAGLVETVKWGHPCYAYEGRNIAIIGANRGGVRLSFFNASLLQDPHGVLQKNGPNTRTPDVLRFADTANVLALEPVIRSYLAEAQGYAAAGIRPTVATHDLILPDELAEALDADPELAEAFYSLTPGRQRSYVIALSSAKTSATRIARIKRLRPKILAGKGAQEH
jgi:uncharacterized protein YdeI (YjbR/CyaY-like superfamily)